MSNLIVPVDRNCSTERLRQLVYAAERIRPEQQAKERELLLSKWFDYRFMSPLKATRLFARHYQDEYRATIERCVDRGLAKNVQGLDSQRVRSDTKTLTSLWSARQHADELGVRYPEYLRFCFQFATGRKRKFLPRPNQLYFTEASEIAWLAKFDEFWPELRLSGLARVEELPQYRIEAYRHLPAQDDYRAFILEKVRHGKSRYRDSMRQFSVELRQIPIRSFIQLTGTELFNDELRSLKVDGRFRPFKPVPHAEMSAEQLWQACFGVPHAFSEESEPCVRCPQARACKRVGDRVLEKVKAAHGTTDPVNEKERRQTRDRVRRYREKKKLVVAKSPECKPHTV